MTRCTLCHRLRARTDPAPPGRVVVQWHGPPLAVEPGARVCWTHELVEPPPPRVLLTEAELAGMVERLRRVA